MYAVSSNGGFPSDSTPGSYDGVIQQFTPEPGQSLNVCIIEAGFFPATPRVPTLAFSLDLLEFYRILRGRAASLGIEPFMKSVCSLQNVHGLLFFAVCLLAEHARL
jgi:hypothetical protein